MTEPTKTPHKRPGRMAQEPKTGIHLDQRPAGNLPPSKSATPNKPGAAADKPHTKANLILGLLRRKEGATLQQLVVATGWLPHTTRAALTGIKRKGHMLSSEKKDGARTYHVGPTEGSV